jgi:hypothetical protein
MVDLAVLDWHLADGSPFWQEIAVFKVDDGGSNQVVAE